MTRPNYMFHRWLTNIPTTNFTQTSGAAYDVSTSIITTVAAATVTEYDFATYFALSDMPNVAEFTTLFDQYKLNRVVFQIKMINVPSNTEFPNSNINNYGNFYPTIWYAPDHDDNVALTIAQLKEYEGVKHRVLQPNRELNISLSPTTLQQVYRSAVTTGYACNFKKPWLDMAQADIPHYGLKFALDFEGINLATNASQGFKFKVNVKYYFGCKNVR